jgi:hypothetical protein
MGSFGRFGGAATFFRNITLTRKSLPNFFIGISRVRFEKNMEKVAKVGWQLTKDGKAKELTYNGIRYVSRLSTSGIHTVDLWKDGVNIIRYRLL